MLTVEVVRLPGVRFQVSLRRLAVPETPDRAADIEAATRALLPHLSQDGYVLSLQNGLGHEDILAALVGRERVLAGLA